jgi:hypothetical protein
MEETSRGEQSERESKSEGKHTRVGEQNSSKVSESNREQPSVPENTPVCTLHTAHCTHHRETENTHLLRPV